MANSFLDRLSKIQQEAAQLHVSLPQLIRLQTEVKKAFDDRIDQLLTEHELLKMIRVPRSRLPINWRYLLSAPFIYGMIFPALLWHAGLEIYHQICFRLYGIPLVNPKEYFIYDRQLLSWLNPWEKVNCLYCSYVNNLVRYSSEIGGRTERYWCPIKYYRRLAHAHSQYDKFVDKTDSTQFRKQWEELRDFSDLK